MKDLLDEPARRAFVADLARMALQHRAVRHPFLRELADGSLPSGRWSIVDFARHYYGYSSHFPRYLTTVISRLEDPEHRAALLANLMQESGTYLTHELHELEASGIQREWIEGVPHPVLFARFCEAVEVLKNARCEADQVVCWRELFLSVLAHGSAAEAVGALGLGTENIVREIYAPITLAISRLGLAPRDTVFFPLHTVVDDDHQATLEDIAADFARTPEGRTGLLRGMLKALQLRSAFWDWLHARAHCAPHLVQEVL